MAVESGVAKTNSAIFVPPPPKISISSVQSKIAKLLKYSTFEPQHRYWLQTGSDDLNATLGSRKKGIPYGKLIELSGLEHGGKTTLSHVLAGMAQKDGAGIGYIDLEDSRDRTWAMKLGMDYDNVLKIYPKLIHDKGKKDKDEEEIGLPKTKKPPRLQSAEEIFDEAEAGMSILAEAGYEKQLWIVDSIAQIQTAKVNDAGITGQTMNTKLSRSEFLAFLLPRWAGYAANYNVTIVLINQLRQKIGMVFGDPFDSPGGRSLRHNLAVRARVKRVKGGQVRKNGKAIGIIGVVKNSKNKAGEGSVQDESCGFKIRWDKDPAQINFMTQKEAEAEV